MDVGSVSVGQFVFFSMDTSVDVLGGTVTSADTDTSDITVHEHCQAHDILERRFTPLYMTFTLTLKPHVV